MWPFYILKLKVVAENLVPPSENPVIPILSWILEHPNSNECSHKGVGSKGKHVQDSPAKTRKEKHQKAMGFEYILRFLMLPGTPLACANISHQAGCICSCNKKAAAHYTWGKQNYEHVCMGPWWEDIPAQTSLEDCLCNGCINSGSWEHRCNVASFL